MYRFFQKHSKLFVGLIPGIWLILFLLVPFLIVLAISFSEGIIAIPPYKSLFSWANKHLLTLSISLENYAFIFSESIYLWAYMNSVFLAFLTTLGCLLLAYPVAYSIVKAPERSQFFLLMLVVLPFWISFLVRVYAWLGLLNNQGVINSLLLGLGIIERPLELLGHKGSVLTGMIYSYLPFMILPLYAALEKIDFSLIEAAYDLGARPFKVFWKIIFPLSRSGALTGAMLVFVPTIGEFVVPELLGGSKVLMVGQMIWNEFFYNRDWPIASALSIVMLVTLLGPIFIFQRMRRG